jgi:hypothetical protein
MYNGDWGIKEEIAPNRMNLFSKRKEKNQFKCGLRKEILSSQHHG